MPDLSPETLNAVSKLIEQQRLPSKFISWVGDFYYPVAQGIAAQQRGDKVSFVGVQGSQGSGKSTCAEFLKLILEFEFGRRTLVTSIDDFYLTRAQRTELAREVHPLFSTRGVPGTHDTALLKTVFEQVRQGHSFCIPVFDKSIDDRAPETLWPRVTSSVDTVILEGWCVGLPPQAESDLLEPVNALERLEDEDVVWRRAVNRALSEEYADVFGQLGALLALQAPSFECVYRWRLLQEQKMLARLEREGKDTSGVQTPAQIECFISYYQRLTQHGLKVMPELADWLIRLNADHGFDSVSKRSQ